MSVAIYRWDSTVRDYELDVQGIVNNATYISYLEQCRNDYARSLGIDFVEYYKAGYVLVVAGLEIQYRRPLGPQDQFYVTATIESYDDKRIHFEQAIKRQRDDKAVATAMVHVACVDQRTQKSTMPKQLKKQIADCLQRTQCP